MKQADVDRVVANAATRGVAADDLEAASFLLAHELLVKNPKHEAALEVIRNFNHRLATGEEVRSFAQFLLPVPYTDEEREEEERIRQAYLASKGNAA